jgi:hypothetical protein
MLFHPGSRTGKRLFGSKVAQRSLQRLGKSTRLDPRSQTKGPQPNSTPADP